MSDWWWNLYDNYPTIYAVLDWFCNWLPTIGGIWGAGTVGLLAGQRMKWGYFSANGLQAAATWPLLVAGRAIRGTWRFIVGKVSGRALPAAHDDVPRIDDQ